MVEAEFPLLSEHGKFKYVLHRPYDSMASRKSGESDEKSESERMVPIDARVSKQLDQTIQLIAEYESVKASEIVRQFLREGVAKYRKDVDFRRFLKSQS